MPPTPPPIPPRPPQWPAPQLLLRCEDLEHEGARLFFQNVDASTVVRDAVVAVFEHLYTHQTVPTSVEQVRLVLRPLDGVAHTFGSTTHKEIHLSLDHIVNSRARAGDEIRGVLTHEMVHCFQHDARGTAPGGLIEGMADYVRLNAGHGPPHWTRRGGEKWDVGYETTGYFLQWLEDNYGAGTVRALNACMKDCEYDAAAVFGATTGWEVGDLWEMYCAVIDSE